MRAPPALTIGLIAWVPLFECAHAQSVASDCPDLSFYEEVCEGNIPQPHDDGLYRFITTSQVRWNEPGSMYAYNVCVENHSSRTLYAHWLIPKYEQWILPGCAKTSSRPSRNPHPLEPYDGCLLYGNLKKPRASTFLPRQADQSEIDAEDCGLKLTQGSIELPIQGGEEVAIPEKLNWQAEAIFPTDLEAPDVTLVSMKIDVGITLLGGPEYLHTMELSLAPLTRSTDAVLDGLQLYPEGDAALAAFEEAMGSEDLTVLQSLHQEVYVETMLPMPAEAELIEFPFAILNADGARLSSIAIPFLR